MLRCLCLAAVSAVPVLAEPAAPETRNCLPIAALRGSTVIDGRTIDFTLRDGSVWRSRLPVPCPQLATEQSFTYETGQSQLCSQDIIRVILPVSGQLVGASCGLAPFERQPARPRRGKPG